MVFSVTLHRNGAQEFIGKTKLVTGSWANTGATSGGEVATGLREVLFFETQGTSVNPGSNPAVVDESFPLAGGDVTIVTDAGQEGIFMAVGI